MSRIPGQEFMRRFLQHVPPKGRLARRRQTPALSARNEDYRPRARNLEGRNGDHGDVGKKSQNRVFQLRIREDGLRNSARTLASHAFSLGLMFEALAPSLDWKWMLPLIRRLNKAATKTENHSDLPSIRELFELGPSLMRSVDAGRAGKITQCDIMYRNGLYIAMLAARPYMRLNNIARIKIGDHIVREGPVYRLQFSSDDMKGGIRLGGPLPECSRPSSTVTSRFIAAFSSSRNQTPTARCSSPACGVERLPMTTRMLSASG
jgi:hypothetical protein